MIYGCVALKVSRYLNKFTIFVIGQVMMTSVTKLGLLAVHCQGNRYSDVTVFIESPFPFGPVLFPEWVNRNSSVGLFSNLCDSLKRFKVLQLFWVFVCF